MPLNLSDHLVINAAETFLNQIPFAEIHDETMEEIEMLREIYEQGKNN